ncbi:MAG: hypothetical protein HYX63_13375 [Gammaproteobacteria bacterium]|nr:hypothetical protein [Gammaproteobacteria bacterium]
MDLAKLKALLTPPPYDKLSNGELVLALNAPTIKVQGKIAKASLMQWAGANRGFTAMEKAAAHPNEDVQNIGKAALAMFAASDVSTFDTSDPDNSVMMQTLVTVGILSAAAVTSLMARGVEMVTPAAQAGLGVVELGHIEAIKGKQ